MTFTGLMLSLIMGVLFVGLISIDNTLERIAKALEEQNRRKP